jgi:predicted HicB family RNase H-like nuclease
MNATHRRTLAAVFENPARADMRWDAIEALFIACGAEISEGRVSRVSVLLNGAEAVFHRPYPRPVTNRGALKSVRRFLSFERSGDRATMNMLRHKDYLAGIELDPEAGIFHGEVINARAVLTFEGRSIDELTSAFADTIADYEDWCRERGKDPERPYSGSLTLRMPPELHRRVAEAAARAGQSLNGFIKDALERAL